MSELQELKKAIERVRKALKSKSFDVWEAAFVAEGVIYVSDVLEALDTKNMDLLEEMEKHQEVDFCDDVMDLICSECGTLIGDGYECPRVAELESQMKRA